MPEIISISQYPPIMQDRRKYSSITHTDRVSYHASSRPLSTLTATNPHWQPLPIRGVPQTLPEHVPHYSAVFSAFQSHEADWSTDSTTIPVTCSNSLPLSFTCHGQTHYPDPSQRAHLPSLGNLSSEYHYQIQGPRSLSCSPVCNDESRRLYTMDEIEVPISCPPSSKPSPSIKIEQSDLDGCFIMELSAAQVNTISLSQSMAPPAEIPLRASHASADMRKMMGRFRIDPFAIHNGENRGVVASWCSEACPLEEEPLIFEFQLDLNGQQDISAESPDDAQSSQASNSASNEHDGDWEEYCGDESIYASNAPSEWDTSDCGDQIQPTTGFYHHQLHELQESYLRGCAEDNARPYLTSANATHGLGVQRAEHQGQLWSRRDVYDPSPRTGAYGADSPECDNAILPSISATVNRRWSVPDPNLAHEAQFLMQ